MRNLLRRWLGIEALEAEVRRRPVQEKQESALIAEWLAERERHPVGSPKYVAYTNRLVELGALSGR